MSRLNKILKHFRLNVEVVALLRALAKQKNTSETEIIEIALRALAHDNFSLEERREIVINEVLKKMGLEDK